MSNKAIEFQSILSPVINQLIQEKRACGYKYETGAYMLKCFDRFLCETPFKKITLPKLTVVKWLEKQDHESTSYHQHRIGLVRQLAQLMVRLGHSAYVPPDRFGSQRSSRFSPRILTHEEIKNIFHALDTLPPIAQNPLRHIVMPELFRLLYGCGFRVGELIKLRVEDVDLKQGVITVREGKFGKDRLVPPSPELIKRLQNYVVQVEKVALRKNHDNDFFFPSTTSASLGRQTIYALFRKLLFQCSIHHAGRGKGPRVHDLRHTFAVHKLIQWYEEGADLNTKLPFLVAYLGHKNYTGTQKYLHLTAELFPNLTKRMNKQFGDVIPGGYHYEAN